MRCHSYSDHRFVRELEVWDVRRFHQLSACWAKHISQSELKPSGCITPFINELHTALILVVVLRLKPCSLKSS